MEHAIIFIPERGELQMKKRALILLVMSMLLYCCCGCSRPKADAFDLPDEPVCFKTGSYRNPDKPEDMYDAIQCDDRVYIPYGSVNNNKIDERDIDDCLGYIARNDAADKGRRVYTLAEDMKKNYVMIYDVETDISQAVFWRATDTRNQKIETPGYIDAIHYDYWE